MPITHNTPADGSFSPRGKGAWEEAHTLPDSSEVEFTPSGSGASAETVSAALQRLPHTAQYATAGNFDTAQAALTGTFGMHQLQIGGYPLTTTSGSYPLRIKTTDTSAGDFTIAAYDNVFNGDRNNVIHFGYNPTPGGSREDTDEPAIFISFESHFDNGSNELFEHHVQGVHADGDTFRHQSVTVNRNTKAIIGYFDASQFSMFSADHSTQAFIFTLDDDNSNWNFSVRTGSWINCNVNNQNWIRQINAAADTYLELIRLNASDKLVLAPAAGVVISGPTTAPEGSNAAPSFAATAGTSTGMYYVGAAGRTAFASAGLYVGAFTADGPSGATALTMRSTGLVAWNSTTTLGSAVDVMLNRVGVSGFGIGGVTGATTTVRQATALLSAVSGASVTASNLIPATSNLLGVVTRVTTGLGTSNGTTGYSVGDGVDADRWGAVVGTVAGTITKQSDATADPTGWFGSANNIVITPTTGNFDGTGAIRVIALYLDNGAPTS